jgi:hypothetical protein
LNVLGTHAETTSSTSGDPRTPISLERRLDETSGFVVMVRVPGRSAFHTAWNRRSLGFCGGVGPDDSLLSSYRGANSTLKLIVVMRLELDDRTNAYMRRRLSEGLSKGRRHALPQAVRGQRGLHDLVAKSGLPLIGPSFEKRGMPVLSGPSVQGTGQYRLSGDSSPRVSGSAAAGVR